MAYARQLNIWNNETSALGGMEETGVPGENHRLAASH
jgi:hypothetical protein